MNSTRKLHLRLSDREGTALLSLFQSQAEREGWDRDSIREVLREAGSGGIGHLLTVLGSYCVDPDGESSYPNRGRNYR